MDLGSILSSVGGSSLAGGLFGGLLRMVPEVFKFLDRKDERKHELAMFDRQLEADKLRSQLAIDQLHAQGDLATVTGDANAWLAAIQGQAVKTGVAWVDAINALVRPILTLWYCIVLQGLGFWATYHLLRAAGMNDWQTVERIVGPLETIAFAILAFWFADRSLRRGGGVGPAH